MKEASRRILPFLKQGLLVVLSIRKAGYFARWEDIYMDLSEVAGRAGILNRDPGLAFLSEQDL